MTKRSPGSPDVPLFSAPALRRKRPFEDCLRWRMLAGATVTAYQRLEEARRFTADRSCSYATPLRFGHLQGQSPSRPCFSGGKITPLPSVHRPRADVRAPPLSIASLLPEVSPDCSPNFPVISTFHAYLGRLSVRYGFRAYLGPFSPRSFPAISGLRANLGPLSPYRFLHF